MIVVWLSHGLLLQIYSVSLKRPRLKNVLYILFCIWMTCSSIHNCTLNQHCMSTCRQNKHTEPPSGSWKCYLKQWELLAMGDNYKYVCMTTHLEVYSTHSGYTWWVNQCTGCHCMQTLPTFASDISQHHW